MAEHAQLDVIAICNHAKNKLFSADAPEGAIFKQLYKIFDRDAQKLLHLTLQNFVTILVRSFQRRMGWTQKLRVCGRCTDKHLCRTAGADVVHEYLVVVANNVIYGVVMFVHRAERKRNKT